MRNVGRTFVKYFIRVRFYAMLGLAVVDMIKSKKTNRKSEERKRWRFLKRKSRA